MTVSPRVPLSRHPLHYVWLGGLVAGALDIIYACTFWGSRGVAPTRILQSVAAGWVGRDAAIAGGWMTALLGLVSHFGIAMAMALAYYLAARRLPSLARHPWRYGALYGLFLYGVMTYAVTPLSAAGNGSMPSWQWIHLWHVAAHVILVGMPCALAARYALLVRQADRH